MKKIAAVSGSILLVTVIIAVISCSGGDSGSGPDLSNKIQLSGTMGTGYTAAAKSSFFAKFFSLAEEAYAVGEPVVDKILAISNDNTIVMGTISGTSFSLLLEKGKPYLVVFLEGTTIVGIYKADGATDLDVFPLSSESSNLDLGTVSLSGGVLTGTVTSADILTALAIDPGIAAAYGIMDEGFLRFSSIDVDGNGVIDNAEHKQYELRLSYEFSSGQTFTDIKGSYSNRANAAFKGYMYFFNANPDDTSLDWYTARLNSTTPISDAGGASTSKLACAFPAPDAEGRHLDFYCGGSAISPSTPPGEDYTVTAAILSGGTKTFTFRNVLSQTIDTTTLLNIYVPEIQLTVDGSNKVTRIDWKWWKNTNSGWVQPSAGELSAVLNGDAGFELLASDWNETDRVRGTITLTPNGSVVPGPQTTWDPAHLRVTYYDKAGYDYGFEWP